MLRAKILKDLNESIYNCKSQKQNLGVTEEINLELRFYTLDLTVDKIYQGMKDYKFWI